MEFENFEDLDDKRSDIFEVRLEDAEKFKVLGNQFFNQKDFFNAEYFYHRALYHIDFDYLQYNFQLQDNHRQSVDSIKHPVCLNLAAVRLSLQNYQKTIDLCNQVLKQDSKNAKAHYRKGLAFKGKKQYQNALDSLILAQKENPTDKNIRKHKLEVKRLVRQERAIADRI